MSTSTVAMSPSSTPYIDAQTPDSSSPATVPPAEQTLQTQRYLLITLDPTGMASVPVIDEGAGFVVVAFAEPGDLTGFELHDETGTLAPLTVGSMDVFETPGSLVAEYPPTGFAATLTVIGAAGASVFLQFLVASEVVAAATATPRTDGTVEIVVTLSGPAPISQDQAVRAFIGNGRDNPIEIPLSDREPQVLTYSTVIEAEEGTFQTVDVEISGTYTRFVSTGFVVGIPQPPPHIGG